MGIVASRKEGQGKQTIFIEISSHFGKRNLEKYNLLIMLTTEGWSIAS
jgi:hypothetical protein